MKYDISITIEDNEKGRDLNQAYEIPINGKLPEAFFSELGLVSKQVSEDLTPGLEGAMHLEENVAPEPASQEELPVVKEEEATSGQVDYELQRQIILARAEREKKAIDLQAADEWLTHLQQQAAPA